ncbi:ORF6N domain-containing protein [bacterium]|nr:ORF6N domain-containing protein [bacterium]
MTDKIEIIDKKEIILLDQIDKEKVKSQIYEVRGLRVMLDSDIAAYFGVETAALNRAMKRNIKRFPPKFCFQISREEYHEILRCQFGILELEQGKYSKYLPYVYTEHGLSMLTSVLHTDRAIEASILIMEVFVEVAHYILQNTPLLPYEDLKLLQNKQEKLSDKIQDIEKNMVKKDELSDFMKLFDTGIRNEEILILDGEPFKADFAYQKIYGTAEHSIIVIDDYLGLKTLRHLASAKSGIQITIISDNKGKNPLKLTEYNDFLKEYPDVKINFIASLGRIHDRYIAIDFGRENEKLYHCGASSKDAGRKITTILEIKGIADYRTTLESLLSNRELKLNL